ncbi:MAG: rRNA maturation RNase YbeY [Clostridia bacterium]|nr:rRNA maturation RNase YbeY [Clostridia bacterium]
MGKLLIENLDKKVRTKKIAKAVHKVLGQKAKIKVELVFEDANGIHNLNRTTRGVDSVTDVLSYPSLDGIRGKVLLPEDCVTELEGKYIFLGSIVLCEEKIRAQAIEYGNTEEQEREYLIIHGLLHLFGYDHMNEEDKKEMRELEKRVLSVLHDKGKSK